MPPLKKKKKFINFTENFDKIIFDNCSCFSYKFLHFGFSLEWKSFYKIALLAGAVEYTDCISVEG